MHLLQIFLGLTLLADLKTSESLFFSKSLLSTEKKWLQEIVHVIDCCKYQRPWILDIY